MLYVHWILRQVAICCTMQNQLLLEAMVLAPSTAVVYGILEFACIERINGNRAPAELRGLLEKTVRNLNLAANDSPFFFVVFFSKQSWRSFSS